MSTTIADGFGKPPALVFETAAAHLTTRVPVVSVADRAGDIRRDLVGRRFDTLAAIAVCDGERFAGLLKLEDLLAAPADAPAGALMDPQPPVAAPGVDQERAAWQAVRRHESALAVVDAQGRFLGLVPPERLLGVLLWEHDEDLARLGGFSRDAAAARAATQEAVGRRLWHRVPWLLLGLAGAFLAADVVALFEAQLRDRVILAFFVPGVVYLADAVGTQTEALVIRGLSLGVPIRRVVGRELLTGLLVGLILAAVFFPVALWRWGQADVALGVALALLAACSIATVVAMALPWALHRSGADPAFGSGPLATVIQDLLSIVLYFVICAGLVGLTS